MDVKTNSIKTVDENNNNNNTWREERFIVYGDDEYTSRTDGVRGYPTPDVRQTHRQRRAKTQARATAKPRRPAGKRATSRSESGFGAGSTAVAAFAHDIRTTLTGVLALSELLASAGLGEREREWVAGIKSGVGHLTALTTLAIDAAQAGNAKTRLQQAPFSPSRLAQTLRSP